MRRGFRLNHLAPALFWAGLSGFALAQTPPPSTPLSDTDTSPEIPAADPGPTRGEGVPPVSIDMPAGLPVAVLVLDVDQAYETSAWGRRAKADIEAAAREIEAENKRLEALLTSEEQALTAERATLAPDAFRRKAEEFDARAQTVRRERAEVARDLGSRADADRNAFLNASLPVVTTLMQEHHAAVVLDRRQTLLAITSVDITAQLVERMDQEVGAGEGLPEPGGSVPEDAAAQAVPPAQTAPADDQAPATPQTDAPATDAPVPDAPAQ
ncbi:OmpH family outer membrane protein [Paracoccus xiamenensis]|uniref:OmpH family outer membrane protein n=1 Tax=Paracoccus xiamenensis TaxID=2714901 RepID=UPI001409AC2D|nr:OmpH family outer membrane protein [Paracoccus xiamenensis]NHF72226.1 OmpH family outer membrane protein [Paracoccus xiamenensis]